MSRRDATRSFKVNPDAGEPLGILRNVLLSETSHQADLWCTINFWKHTPFITPTIVIIVKAKARFSELIVCYCRASTD